MIPAADKPPLLASQLSAPSQDAALRRLFLTLYLRGRGARGLNRKTAPKSVGSKLRTIVLLYGMIGCVSLSMIQQPLFALAIYLHAMTFAFLGMFVASSAGEILFNKEEADILMHRPIDSGILLRSKIRVMVLVALWVVGSFNLVGLFAGVTCPDSSWRFPIAHAVSIVIEALFCTGFVILLYQLCLRWFGRERLDGLMTTMQVFVAVAVVLGSQLLPRLMFRFGGHLAVSQNLWWLGLLPPVWFADFDEAIAGSGTWMSWLYAVVSVLATGLVLWLAFARLAHVYDRGLQTLNEAVPKRKSARRGLRWLDRLVNMPPLRWWLREPVSRASFMLTVGYLIRDRDVKLRIYPGIAPLIVMPFIFLFQSGPGMGNFGIAFSGACLGLIPLLALSMLQYSQQWQASDVFRSAPMRGPAAIYHGARRAVLFFFTFPILLAIAIVIWLVHGANTGFLLLLPGIVALPVYSLVPGLVGKAIPLSVPIEEAKSANRGLFMVFAMVAAMLLGAVASIAWSQGFFRQLVIGESAVVIGLYAGMRYALGRVRWKSAE